MTVTEVTVKYAPSTIDVSSDLIDRIDIWAKATDGIGRFKIKLKNEAGEYLGQFAADDAVEIKIATAVCLRGYLDKGLPISEALKSVYDQTFELAGRDYGQDLQNLLVDKSGDWMYPKQSFDLIIDDMLAQAGSEITFTPVGMFTQIQYTDQGDEFLIEAFRKILERVNWDMRVEITKALNLIPVSNPTDTGIVLKCVAGAADNNILHLEKLEFDSTELRNYIIGRSGKIRDGWSEGNAEDFTGLTGNVITNETSTVAVGAASLKCAKGTESDCKLLLTFPKYNYTVLDFSAFRSEDCEFQLYVTGAGPPYPHVLLWLEDSSGNQIFYGWEMADTPKTTWLSRPFPVGTECNILPYANAKPKNWSYGSGYSTFDWSSIKKIWWYGADSSTIIVDGLNLPIPMVSYKQDGTSQGLYKVRHWPLPVKDVRSQKELDELADSELAKRKDPITGLKIIAKGTAGISGTNCLWAVCRKLKVNSPGDDISNVYYRIIDIHLAVSDQPLYKGYDFIAELILVPVNAVVSGKRLAYTTSDDVALLRDLNDRVRLLEKREAALRDWSPALPGPLSIQNQTDSFFVIKDTYANRPAAGVEGRIFYATDLGWYYYDDGTHWHFTASEGIRDESPSLVPNFSFEYDEDGDGTPDKWIFSQLVGSPTCGISASIRRHGLKSVYITCLTTEEGRLSSEKVKILEGRRYVSKIRVKASAAANSALNLVIRWYDKDDVYLSNVALGASTVGTSWTLFQINGIAPANAAKAAVWLYNVTPSVNCTIYFDYCYLQQSDTPEGTTFPSNPHEGELFKRTDQSNGITYRWNAGTSEWLPVDYLASSNRMALHVVTEDKIVDYGVSVIKTNPNLGVETVEHTPEIDETEYSTSSTTYITVKTFSYIASQYVKHSLRTCKFKFRTAELNEAAWGKVEYSIAGGAWQQFSSVRSENGVTYVEETLTETVTAGLNQSLDVRFRLHGTNGFTAYMKDCTIHDRRGLLQRRII